MRRQPSLLQITGLRGRKHFFEARDPLEDLARAILAQRPHPAFDTGARDGGGIAVVENLLAHSVADHEQLVDADTAAIAGVRAGLAARVAIEHWPFIAEILFDQRIRREKLGVDL